MSLKVQKSDTFLDCWECKLLFFWKCFYIIYVKILSKLTQQFYVRKELKKEKKISFIYSTVSETRILNQSNNVRTVKQKLENLTGITLIYFALKTLPLLPYLKFVLPFQYCVFLYLCQSCVSFSSITVLSFCSVLYLRMYRRFSWHLAVLSQWKAHVGSWGI